MDAGVGYLSQREPGRAVKSIAVAGISQRSRSMRILFRGLFKTPATDLRQNSLAKIKRIYCRGHPYFITNVTYERHPIMLDNVDMLWEAVGSARTKADFDLMAWVILPEHFHFLLDVKNANISKILQRIKLSFSARFRKRYGLDCCKVWQNGFWDHVIRDERDLNNHLNYIHFNPVRHGLTNNPFKYEHSSLIEYSDRYPADWGITHPLEFEGDFGE
jgi:putative transposase